MPPPPISVSVRQMKPYKTVSARAVEDTKIIKLPFSAFKIAFEKYPDAYLRVVQIVMIR